MSTQLMMLSPNDCVVFGPMFVMVVVSFSLFFFFTIVLSFYFFYYYHDTIIIIIIVFVVRAVFFLVFVYNSFLSLYVESDDDALRSAIESVVNSLIDYCGDAWEQRHDDTKRLTS
jgi:hypothetical protein